jgi:uncharacterized protein YfaS (alpha-2-macroglobulin family)
MLTGIRLPVPDAAQPGAPALYAVRLSGRAGRDTVAAGPLSLVQVTDLGVHARIGTTEGVVWVTGVNDGAAKAGASVTLHDAGGRLLATATTDARGLARLTGWGGRQGNAADDEEGNNDFEGYVRVTVRQRPRRDGDQPLGSGPVAVALRRPERVGRQAPPARRGGLHGAGIYRPGERVYAKASFAMAR